MRNIYLSLLLILVIPVSSFCQIQEWRKLVPLESTREDVEKIIGKPVKQPRNTTVIYDTKIGEFEVDYSSGECREGFENIEYYAPEGRMMSITLTFKPLGLLEDYFPDKLNFKKVAIPNVNNNFFYFSSDNSIVVETVELFKKKEEFVRSITIRPDKNKQHLLCKNIKNIN